MGGIGSDLAVKSADIILLSHLQITKNNPQFKLN
jgi:hypothetical protein